MRGKWLKLRRKWGSRVGRGNLEPNQGKEEGEKPKNGAKSPKFGPKMGSEWDGILQDWGKGVKKGKKLTEITQI